MDYEVVYQDYKRATLDLLMCSLEQGDKNLVRLFPHLQADEIKAILDEGSFVAMPPLLMSDTFHVVGPVAESDPRLMYHGCFSRQKHDAGNILYIDRAHKFGRTHFKGHFFKDPYQFVLNIILRRYGFPSSGIKEIWLLVNADPAVIVGNKKTPKTS